MACESVVMAELVDHTNWEAVLPPPGERKHVKTAVGAARAEQGRKNRR